MYRITKGDLQIVKNVLGEIFQRTMKANDLVICSNCVNIIEFLEDTKEDLLDE